MTSRPSLRRLAWNASKAGWNPWWLFHSLVVMNTSERSSPESASAAATAVSLRYISAVSKQRYLAAGAAATS